MTDVEIRSCVVRVVRRDGWSWGSDPRGLLDEVLAAVSQLIEDALVEVVPEGISGEIREPIHVGVPLLRRADLRALVRRGTAEQAAANHVQPLKASLSGAVRRTLVEQGLLGVKPGDLPVERGAPTAAERVESVSGQAVLRVLLGLRRAGKLPGLLERLPEPVLESWQKALLSGWRGSSAATAAAEELAQVLDEMSHLAEPAAQQPAGWLRARIAAMTAIAARTGAVPSQPSVLSAIEAWLGPRPAEAPLAPELDAVPGVLVADVDVVPGVRGADVDPIRAELAGAELTTSVAAIGSPLQRARPSVGGTLAPPITSMSRSTPARLSSALPFLVLVQLARIGWIDVLSAGVEAGGLTGHWPSFAAALAFSVLDEPENGWRRSPHDLATAAAFAGVPAPFIEQTLPEGAPLLSAPLDAVLGLSLADGHQPGEALLIVPTGQPDGLVLFDSTGMFPMAWVKQRDDLAGWLAACPGSPVIPSSDAGPIGSAGPDDREMLDRAGAVLDGLRARRALPLTSQPDLELSFVLAAGTALASIGWTMWGADEPTDPLLTLQRLASLDALVHDEQSRLRVLLPLGARYFALHEYGLLGEVANVPWLDGRSVEIEGG